jgi:tetratricopeptide (TPR) repeat protein
MMRIGGGWRAASGGLVGLMAVLMLGCGSKSDSSQKSKTTASVKEALKRAKKHEDKKDPQKAIDEYSQAIKLDPKNTAAYGHRGILYHDKGERQKALADFSKVIELDPKSKPAYLRRAMVYNESGDRHKALADFSKAIELDPRDSYPYEQRAGIYKEVLKDDARANADKEAAAAIREKRWDDLKNLRKK